eukprot:COSAG01_NODE_1624_length_9704_cov_186.948777_11_plen_69_part_00
MLLCAVCDCEPSQRGRLYSEDLLSLARVPRHSPGMDRALRTPSSFMSSFRVNESECPTQLHSMRLPAP